MSLPYLTSYAHKLYHQFISLAFFQDADWLTYLDDMSSNSAGCSHSLLVAIKGLWTTPLVTKTRSIR